MLELYFHSLWARGFRFSFTPLPGSFSPFPHGTVLYRSLWVFSLGGWSPLLPARFHVSRSTLVPPVWINVRVRGFHPLRPAFPKPFCLMIHTLRRPATPRCSHRGLGSSAFARRYLRNRSFFLFLPLLRCFSSRTGLPYVMDWRMDV